MMKEKSMEKKEKVLMYSQPKGPQPKIPEPLKAEVTTRVNEFIDSVLKPRYIKAPNEKPQFNYIVDISSKWYQSYCYLCSQYCCPSPDALVPGFEHKFARMQYAGNNHFHLSFMRYNGEWVPLYADQTLDECLTAIKDEDYFVIG
jgi:hypothetical protein